VFNCYKISSQNAPKLAILSSKIYKTKILVGLPTPYPFRRLVPHARWFVPPVPPLSNRGYARGRFSLFGYYATPPIQTADYRHEQQPSHYLYQINSVTCSPVDNSLASRYKFNCLHVLFERVLCAPPSSAPVERIFSQSGLLIRQNHARMSDTLLESLVFFKCNAPWLITASSRRK